MLGRGGASSGQEFTCALDHILWAAPDLETAVAEVEARCGVRAAAGGRHLQAGTHNALLSLGPGRYLELIARDPRQETLRGFGSFLEGLPESTLLTWAVACDDIEAVADAARGLGFALEGPSEMSRQRPDGSRLGWQILFLSGHPFGLALPFFIHWTDRPHPSEEAPKGCTLSRLILQHPRPEDLQGALAKLGIEQEVAAREQTRLSADLDTPKGKVRLA